MSTATSHDLATADDLATPGSSAQGPNSPDIADEPMDPRPTRRWWTPVVVAVATALLSVVPVLFDRAFYERGDTAAQFGPTWYHLGELVRSGQWPPWLDPGSWVGGNYAGEALFGIYNPLNVLIWVFVSLMPDLTVAVFLVKAATLVVLALGVLALAREYDAADPAAALVAVAVPFAGYTLYWDAGSWASGLIAFAYTPWMWWAFRRVLRGRLNLFWGFLIGSLAVLQGNPYGTLAVVLVGAGLVLEALATRNRAGLARLLLLGVCVAAWLPLVYLPLLETASIGARSAGATFLNTGKMRPQLGDLLGLGAPTYVPGIASITGPTYAPVTYGAWFVLPLLPWIRYDALRRVRAATGGLAALSGVGAIGLVYLALTVGPSKLWLFRWPLRLVEYAYLALAVAFAVLLSQGVRRDHRLARGVGSLALVLAMAWMTWSQDPARRGAVVLGTVLLLVLTALLLAALALHRLGPVAVVGILGTALVLVAQCHVFGENAGSRVWHFPGEVSALQQQFSSRTGEVMQFADLKPLQKPGRDRELRAAWSDYLAGSMYHVAGVDAVNNYTGIGFARFTRALCMRYDGLTQKCGYARVWRPDQPGGPPLATLMKLDTVVVQPRLAQGVTVPSGWQQQTPSASGAPLVLRRTGAERFPGSRLSDASGVQVGGARTDGPYTQRVRVSGGAADTSPGRLTFALLAWPGYHATLGGRELDVRPDSAGLLRVTVPAGATGEVELTYRPPGLLGGLLLAAVGTVVAVLAGLALALTGRRRRARGDRRTDDEAVPAP